MQHQIHFSTENCPGISLLLGTDVGADFVFAINFFWARKKNQKFIWNEKKNKKLCIYSILNQFKVTFKTRLNIWIFFCYVCKTIQQKWEKFSCSFYFFVSFLLFWEFCLIQCYQQYWDLFSKIFILFFWNHKFFRVIYITENIGFYLWRIFGSVDLLFFLKKLIFFIEVIQFFWVKVGKVLHESKKLIWKCV